MTPFTRYMYRCPRRLVRLIATLGLLAVTIKLAPSASAAGQDLETLLIGSWSCQSGSCPDEEISFSISEGVGVYDSWLHQRPSAVNGSWQVENGRLTIVCCAGLTYDYTIIEVSRGILRLRDAETADDIVMARVNARE